MDKFTRQMPGKSVEPEASLRSKSIPKGNDIKAPGNRQAETEKTTSDGGSNLETLRLGSKPKPEAVREAKQDTKCQKSALSLFQRESGDTGKKSMTSNDYSRNAADFRNK